MTAPPRAGPPNERGPDRRAPDEAAGDDTDTPQDSTVRYSRGGSKTDAYPIQRTASTFAEFASTVLADRARAKGRQYICGPFRANGDGRHHRCKDDALPRRFVAFDVDGTDPEGFAALVSWLQRSQGFA